MGKKCARFAFAAAAVGVLLLGTPVHAQTGSIGTANLGANQVTLQLKSSATGTGHFTVLAGGSATCGTAAQTLAGKGSTGAAAFRIGSLPLTATVAGNYTVKNLTASTAYTVCFTPGGSAPPVAANVTTAAATASAASAWTAVGGAGFSAGEAAYQSLSFSPDGTPFVAYLDYANGQRATVMKYNGTSWVVVGSVGFSAGTAYYESLSFSPDGTPYVAYEDSGNGNKATVMKYNGTSWVPVGIAGFSAGEADYESLSFSPDGTPFLAYQDYGNGQRATVMKYNGTSWVPVGIAAFSAGVADYESLSFSPDGTPFLAYADYSDGQTATVMKYNGASWVVVGRAGQADYESLSFSPDGTPYLAYSDYGNGKKATVMKYNGTSWVPVGSGGISAGEADYGSLSFSSDGTPFVAYLDVANGQRATVMKYNGTSWVVVGSAGFSASQAYYESLSFSPDGTPFVAYLDYGNGQRATVMKFVQAPAATTGAATSITGTGATLNAVVNDDGLATTVAFEYGTTAGYGTTVAAATPPGGNLAAGSGSTASSVTIASLSPGTTYHFRVQATGNGFTVTGNDGTFKTPAVPTITSISPSSGPSGGGTTVTIIGNNFDNANIVSFGSTTAAGYTVNSASQITATSPAGVGTVDVIVTTAGGSSAPRTADRFTYAPQATGNIGTANLGANQVTLQLKSSATGTGHFTVLAGGSATCGTAAQTLAGQGSTGAAAFRIGSLPLTATVAGNYTVKNLTASTAYTVCFTPDGSAPPVAANVTTPAATAFPASAWTAVGGAGFSAGQAYYESFSFSPDGTPFVAYADYANGQRATVMKYNGTSWVAVGSAGFSAGATLFESLSFSPNGTAFLAYTDLANGNKATVMKYNGTAWVPVGSAGFSAGAAFYESLTFSPDGTPFVAYEDSGNGAKSTVMKYNGTAWVPVGSVGFSAGEADYESLSFSPDGTPFVAYSDYGNGQRATVMKYNGSSWVVVGSAGFSAGTAYSESLSFSPDGTPFVAYADNGNGQRATVMKYNGTSWVAVGSMGFSAGVAASESLSFSPDGTPFVAYRDYANGQRATVLKYNGTAWVPVGSVGFSAFQTDYTSLSFSPDGTPFVAYEDSGYGQRATVMKLVQAPAATTGAATSITGTGATLNAVVNDDGAATTVAFQYGTIFGYDTTVAATTPPFGNLAAGSGSTAATVAISTLKLGTTYHFRVTATGNGVTVNGDDATFTTPAVPTVTSISPSSGPSVGGTTVTIIGNNFNNATMVSFGSAAAARYIVLSASQISAISPVGVGIVDVIVTTASGSSATGANDRFTYQKLTPIVTAGSPSVAYGTSSATLTASVVYTGPPAPTGGLTFTVNGLSTGVGTVTCTGSASPLSCSASYNSASLAAGTYAILATEATDANYAAASNTASASLTITQATAPITFLVGNHTYAQAPFAVFSSSASTGAFTYTVVSGPATVAGSTVTLTGVGPVVLQASQAADNNYKAGTKSASFSVGVATPVISFAVPNHTYGDAPFSVAATSTSPVALTYSVVSGPATILGSTVTLNGAGAVVLRASQDANANYALGTQNASFSVSAAIPAIAFSVPNHVFGDPAFGVAATTNSTGVLSYSVVSGPATIVGSTVTLTGAGSVTLQAAEVADSNYTASTQNATFTVSTTTPTQAFIVSNHTYGDAPFTVAANSRSTGPFTYSVVSGPATVLGSTVTLTGAGTVILQASQAADSNYLAAATNAVFSVAKASATVSLGNLAQTYTGSPLSVTSTTSPLGLNVLTTYNGSSIAPTAAGSYAVIGTVSDSNYAGTGNGTLVISKIAASITLSGLTITYDGTAHAATATTTPAGLTVTFTYNGSVSPPALAGTYAVVATINDARYQGTQTGTMVISAVVSSPALLTATIVVTNVGNGYQMSVTEKNSGGTTAASVQLTSATLGAATGTPVPASFGSIAPGGSATVLLTFPASAGAPGAPVVEKIAGSYTGGTLLTSLRTVLPAQLQ